MKTRSLNTLFYCWLLFLLVDVSAYFGGRPKRAEWYHIVPGGGFVRLYQATHGMQDQPKGATP